jgi:diguanylate cyclase (GGDEF)-like protein
LIKLNARLQSLANPALSQLLAIVMAVVLIVAITLVTSGKVIDSSTGASVEAHEALLASDISRQVESVVLYLKNAEVGLSSTARLELFEALKAHDSLVQADRDVQELARLDPAPAALALRDQMQEAKAGLNTFFQTQKAEDLARESAALNDLSQQVGRTLPHLVADSEEHHTSLRAAARLARVAIVVVALAVGAIVCFTTFLISRGRRRAFLELQSERDHLGTMTLALQKRNDQFAALYNVVAEVTDSLSMRYVVNTAVQEARKLVGADYVALRLLHDDMLQIAGGLGDDEVNVGGLADLPLGVGIVGRAAKRGKTLRLNEAAYASMADQEKITHVESGIVVPLIVGARVLGTLGCWSRHAFAFDADDERILELMASQVATAVAAADLHQATAQSASHDALTGLPNRRQLVEDEQYFGQLIARNERLAVLMFDIDHFKNFNDDFGHRVGDVTLQKVAEVLRQSLRDGDRIYRYGGEEFLVVLPGVDAQEALSLADRFRKAVEKTPLTGTDLEPVGPVTISAGVALGPDHGTAFEDLVAAADQALYLSKEAGRNRVTLAAASRATEFAA